MDHQGEKVLVQAERALANVRQMRTYSRCPECGALSRRYVGGQCDACHVRQLPPVPEAMRQESSRRQRIADSKADPITADHIEAEKKRIRDTREAARIYARRDSSPGAIRVFSDSIFPE